MTTYKGFSFKNWENSKSFVLTDVDIVKQDLLNHIFTRKGSRRGQNGFGTTVEDLLFEPLGQTTITLISEQVRSVIDFDPRVILREPEDFQAIPDTENSFLTIRVNLFFVELNLNDVLDINLRFES